MYLFFLYETRQMIPLPRLCCAAQGPHGIWIQCCAELRGLSCAQCVD